MMKAKCKDCGNEIEASENLSAPYQCGDCWLYEVERRVRELPSSETPQCEEVVKDG